MDRLWNYSKGAKMKYKISIIIPVYNVENYIRKALESILSQTIGYEHLEVIMVDDCSTDKSDNIVDEYANKYENFKAIHLSKNSGKAGKPKNIGIKTATTDYLMFLDADDYYADDACEVLYKKIKEEDVDIVSSNYITVYENRTEFYQHFKDIDEIKVNTIHDEPRLLAASHMHWTKIYKRQFILDNRIKFIENIPNDDLVFVVNAFFEANGIIYLDKHFAVNYSRICESAGIESVSRAKNMETLMLMTHGYIETFNLLKNYGKKEYFPIVFQEHLRFWANNFILSNTTYTEKNELLKEIGILFEEFNQYGVIPNDNYLIPFFNSISNKECNKAISISESLKDLLIIKQNLEDKTLNLEKHLKITLYEKNSLQKELKITKERLSKILSTNGYLKYKLKNIVVRIKNKLKKKT